MTLIPLMTSLLSPHPTARVAHGGGLAPRTSYDPGASHRPLAAALAIGLPAAIVVAVALSPMISVIVEKSKPTIVTTVPLPTPPEPEVKPRTDPLPAPPMAAPIPRTILPPLAPADLRPLPPIEIPAGMGAGTGEVAGPPIEKPIPPARLVLAELDTRYLATFQPDYPVREQRAEVEGVATVRVLIGTDGRVKQVDLVRTDSPGFFETTKKRALAKWRFKPASRGGVPEESWKVMTVRFELRNA